MKEYLKPYIEDEEIIIEDICKTSQVDETTDGKELEPWDEWM